MRCLAQPETWDTWILDLYFVAQWSSRTPVASFQIRFSMPSWLLALHIIAGGSWNAWTHPTGSTGKVGSAYFRSKMVKGSIINCLATLYAIWQLHESVLPHKLSLGQFRNENEAWHTRSALIRSSKSAGLSTFWCNSIFWGATPLTPCEVEDAEWPGYSVKLCYRYCSSKHQPLGWTMENMNSK